MSFEMLHTFKTSAILAVYNHLFVNAQLKSWDKNKNILVERMAKAFDKDVIEAAIVATDDGVPVGKRAKAAPAKKTKAAKVKAEKPAKAKREPKAKGEAKPRGKGIGATIRELILANPEAPALDILTSFQKKFPEASTTVGCVGWYRSQMYKTGALVK